MRKKKFLKACFLLAVMLLLANFLGCELTVQVEPEFVGTWEYSTTITIQQKNTLTFSSTTLNFNFSGLVNGTLNATINSYDENSNHIEGTVTSATGIFTIGYSTGSKIYITYNINGDKLTFQSSNSSYPDPSSLEGQPEYTKK